MKKLLLVLGFSLLALNVAYAEKILLKCEFIDGKLHRYKNNKFYRSEKIPDIKEYEIILNPALKKIISAPSYSSIGLEMEQWQDDYILWMTDTNIVGAFDGLFTYSLDRVTGVLTEDRKSFIRVIEDGKYQKDSKGEWIRDTQYHVTSTYQCEKKDRLF
tara:strand:+ start:36 stop:512 length:477 start_codon:yes stop_codon:yes gene_type:complete